jgi:hypothetical protein
VLILKEVKVVYFDELLQVLILKTITLRKNCADATGLNAIQENGVARGRTQKRQQDAGVTDAGA